MMQLSCCAATDARRRPRGHRDPRSAVVRRAAILPSIRRIALKHLPYIVSTLEIEWNRMLHLKTIDKP